MRYPDEVSGSDKTALEPEFCNKRWYVSRRRAEWRKTIKVSTINQRITNLTMKHCLLKQRSMKSKMQERWFQASPWYEEIPRAHFLLRLLWQPVGRSRRN